MILTIFVKSTIILSGLNALQIQEIYFELLRYNHRITQILSRKWLNNLENIWQGQP